MIFLACGAHAGYYSVKLWALRVDLNFRTILKNSKQIVDFICGCYYLSRGRLIIDFCNYLFSGLYLLLAVGVLNYLISIFILTSIKCPFVFKYSALTGSWNVRRLFLGCGYPQKWDILFFKGLAKFMSRKEFGLLW